MLQSLRRVRRRSRPQAVQAALKRAPSLERLASHADPVRALCGATCAHPSLDRTKYRSLVAAAAAVLERISKARRSLGILALSPFTHFPEVEGALATLGLDELIDGAGSRSIAQLRHNHTELIGRRSVFSARVGRIGSRARATLIPPWRWA